MMGFLTSFIAATIENPRFSLNDPEAWEAFGASQSSAGISVSPESAMHLGTWYRAINLVSGDVAKLPLHVYKRISDKGKERATGHPAYYLMRRKPNEWMTAFDLKKLLTAHAMGWGNGYAYIFRDGGATPLEILPLDPSATYPVRENGKLWYVTSVNGEQRKLKAEDVLHIKNLGGDGIQGYKVTDKAKDAIGLSVAADRYATIYFKNSGRPAVTLEIPTHIDEKAKQALTKSWAAMHEGLNNAHRTAILDKGMKAHVLSFSAEESQLLKTREFQARDIANFTGVPPHKLGDPQALPYNSRESAEQAYLDEGLDPWLVTWEEQCWDKLLTEEEKEEDTHFFEFLRNALVRADLAARSGYYRTATGGRPWLTPDEVRSAENMNPMGGEAAELKDPLNMGQGGPDNEKKPAQPPTPPKKKEEEPPEPERKPSKNKEETEAAISVEPPKPKASFEEILFEVEREMLSLTPTVSWHVERDKHGNLVSVERKGKE